MFPSDLEIISLGIIAKAGAALVALAMLRYALKWLDRAIGFNFKDWIANASSSDRAMYLSARIIAVAIVMGCAIS